MDRKKQQVPPLHFASVGMTLSFKIDTVTTSQGDDSVGVLTENNQNK
jgi:hypothetical protein